ncbi:MAG: hypothetical protein [Bacteroides phage LoVEphage]|nr:MAG: hypothetical protein [Bacteroides phage LoVEphage]
MKFFCLFHYNHPLNNTKVALFYIKSKKSCLFNLLSYF